MKANKLINIVYNQSKISLDTFEYVKSRLIRLDYQVSETFDFGAALTITIGGDGSFLGLLHQYNFPNIPFVGINTGHLGFFSEVAPNQIDELLTAYINQDYFIEEIHPVEAIVCTRTNCFHILGLNEIVIKGNCSRTVHLDIYMNEQLIQHFSGDGILVSNSTGSTAYNYSAGGSIVDPALNVLQVTPIAPINTTAYRSFTSSVILPSVSKIKVIPEYHYEDSVIIVSDGVETRHPGITDVEVKQAELKISMLRLNNFKFWDRVKEKFL